MTHDPIRRLRDAGTELTSVIVRPPAFEEVIGGHRHAPRRSPLVTVGLALAALAIGAILFAGLTGSFEGGGPAGRPTSQPLRATVTEGAAILPNGYGFAGSVPVAITNTSATFPYDVMRISCAALNVDGRPLFWFRSSLVHVLVRPGATVRVDPRMRFDTDQPVRPSGFRCHIYSARPVVTHGPPTRSPTAPNPDNPIAPGFQPTDTGFWDTSHGLVAGRIDCHTCADKISGAVAATDDGGRSWRVILSTPNPAHVTVARGTSSAWVWAGGERLRSADFGATWQRLRIGGVIPETFINASDGWGFFPFPNNQGSGPKAAVLARTTDGGKTWTGSSSPCPPQWFFGPGVPVVSFVSASDGLLDCHWEVGAESFSNDAVYRTQDAGATWALLAMDIWPHGPHQGQPPAGDAMSVSPDGAIAMAGGRAGTFRTIDGGGTWAYLHQVSSPGGFTVQGFSWASPTTVFATRAGGPPPAILRSDDAGQTWHVVLKFPFD
jgi:photosystem II stability/assembly factor-like uncharacterized protein